MRKATSHVRGSSAKNTAALKTVDEYLGGVPEPARSTLNKVRAVIRSVVPTETTEVISYRIPMPLAEATGWLEGYRQFWEGRFQRLDALLHDLKTQHPKTHDLKTHDLKTNAKKRARTKHPRTR